ncbi:LOW QUALITY PROTEIN: hypothetical protein PHMEG_0008114 [Phytophthora megakarya]|uniref:Ubiquitin-like protease family profile domain-containing protein n=1 Tax=Phytophthora megakarya TaxID=4795 RepID=A0A225WKE5_9STRA|nr:LOW QUALITY PROTEIN: hypothetical protein PHMEG_0008114 [Phytophthora megakarya]
MYTITKRVATSVSQNSVPPFLSRVAARLSPDIFKKVKHEWERYVVVLCEENQRRFHNGKFIVGQANTITMTLSGRVPVYFIERTIYHALDAIDKCWPLFPSFPAPTIEKRWCVQEARVIAEELESATASLSRFVQCSKLWLPKNLVLLEDDMSKQRRIGTASPKLEKDVRLRRNERANRVVLSSSQKYVYAKATVEQLLEHLSSLSSTDFYEELKPSKHRIESERFGPKRSYSAGVCRSESRDIDASDDEYIKALDRWLEQDWTEVETAHVGLFAREVNALGLTYIDSQQRNQELAAQIIPKLRTTCLHRRFRLPSLRSLLLFDQLVGHLRRGSLLNDSVIELCLQFIADEAKVCHIMSSLATSAGWPAQIPKQTIFEIQHVILPVNLNRDHWGGLWNSYNCSRFYLPKQ